MKNIIANILCKLFAKHTDGTPAANDNAAATESLKTICYNEHGAALYTFDGANHAAAEMALQSDLRVWGYKVITEDGRAVYIR